MDGALRRGPSDDDIGPPGGARRPRIPAVAGDVGAQNSKDLFTAISVCGGRLSFVQRRCVCVAGCSKFIRSGASSVVPHSRPNAANCLDAAQRWAAADPSCHRFHVVQGMPEGWTARILCLQRPDGSIEVFRPMLKYFRENTGAAVRGRTPLRKPSDCCGTMAPRPSTGTHRQNELAALISRIQS